MAPVVPPVLEHIWPETRDEFEQRNGVTYCRRCGRMLAGDRRPGFEQTKPCRVVRVGPR